MFFEFGKKLGLELAGIGEMVAVRDIANSEARLKESGGAFIILRGAFRRYAITKQSLRERAKLEFVEERLDRLVIARAQGKSLPAHLDRHIGDDGGEFL